MQISNLGKRRIPLFFLFFFGKVFSICSFLLCLGGKHMNSAGLFFCFLRHILFFFVSEVTRGYVRICFFEPYGRFFGWVGRYWWVNLLGQSLVFWDMVWTERWLDRALLDFVVKARIPINLQWVHISDMLLFVLGNQGISFSNKKSNKYPPWNLT